MPDHISTPRAGECWITRSGLFTPCLRDTFTGFTDGVALFWDLQGRSISGQSTQYDLVARVPVAAACDHQDILPFPDYDRLRTLREKLRQNIAAAEHRPEDWAVATHMMGGISSPVPVLDTERPRDALTRPMVEPGWGSFSYKRDAWLAVAAVRSLPEILQVLDWLLD